MKCIEVVAAIIHNAQGKILSTQRGYGDWKDYWEFPGGKIESGESAEEALQREILEELDIHIEIENFFYTVEWDYPKFHLIMHCYLCHIETGYLTLKEHKTARWLSKEELDCVQWLPADKEIIERLQNVSASCPGPKPS